MAPDYGGRPRRAAKGEIRKSASRSQVITGGAFECECFSSGEETYGALTCRRTSDSLLAGRAEIGGSLSLHEVADRRGAATAGLTGPLVDVELLAEVAGRAVGIDVIAQRGPALPDRLRRARRGWRSTMRDHSVALDATRGAPRDARPPGTAPRSRRCCRRRRRCADPSGRSSRRPCGPWPGRRDGRAVEAVIERLRPE